jgi:hypothetical protein
MAHAAKRNKKCRSNRHFLCSLPVLPDLWALPGACPFRSADKTVVTFKTGTNGKIHGKSIIPPRMCLHLDLERLILYYSRTEKSGAVLTRTATLAQSPSDCHRPCQLTLLVA